VGGSHENTWRSGGIAGRGSESAVCKIGENAARVVSGKLRIGLNQMQMARFYRKMRHVGRMPKRVKKKVQMRLEGLVEAVEHMDESHMDELFRLGQEDVFNMKRQVLRDMQEREKLSSAALSEEEANMQKDRLAVTQGKLENLTAERLLDKDMMKLHRRRLMALNMDITMEELEMMARREAKEDDEARRSRRANAFRLSEYDAERGHVDEYFEVPDDEKYNETTRNTMESLEAQMEHEGKMLVERREARIRYMKRRWQRYWARENRGKLSWMTWALKTFPRIRAAWTDDDRCWRSPQEWHTYYNLALPSRLTDSVFIKKSLIEAAHKTALSLWEECEPTTTTIETKRISAFQCAPTIAPSRWDYPGNLVCLMDRHGRLDIWRRNPVDRDAWFIGRLKLSDSLLRLIPPGYGISGVQLGESHLALFVTQLDYLPTRPNPNGSAWLVPKDSLATGDGVLPLPSVPLAYFKPYSVKDKLLAIGYNSPKDPFYKVYALDRGEGQNFENSSWLLTDINTLPIYFVNSVLIDDYPESMHKLGTTSICTAADESKIFITVPSKVGQCILTIDTETWDFNLQEFAIPPVWGSTMFHDPDFNRLILAGGSGHSCPEPLVRALDLDAVAWTIERSHKPLHMGAYGTGFEVGPGSYVMVGGFWRSGYKKFNLQPSSSVILFETTPFDDFLTEHFYDMYIDRYAAAKDTDALEEGAENVEPELEFDDSQFDMGDMGESQKR
jgi:hypothetical protein